MPSITKQTFLNTLTCSRLGWLTAHPAHSYTLTHTPASLADQLRMEQGIEIGKRARSVYPEGILVEQHGPEAIEQTKQLLSDTNTNVIFEATFQFNNYIARADILERTESGWHLIEVKSFTKESNDLIDDLAYTATILQQSGLKISETSLMLVSKDYRIGMDENQLFELIPCFDKVQNKVDVFRTLLDQVDQIIQNDSAPEPDLILDCKSCQLREECHGNSIHNHIFDLPRLSDKKFQLLKMSEIIRIEDIPEVFDLTANQKVIRDGVVKGGITILKKSSEELVNVKFPAHYLDFETMSTAIPLYPNVAPYAQIPVQYSIHTCSAVNEIQSHKEYLAGHTKDCRLELAERLIQDLDGDGSIFVYSGFEQRIIKDLTHWFPQLETSTYNIISRMIDLEKIIRETIYHVDLHGSYSIKKVLPALVPDLSYNDLAINNGDMASSVYVYMVMGKYDEKEIEKHRKDLLKYCQLDTEAMVRLHGVVEKYVS